MRALAVIALLSASTLPQAVLGQAESLDLRAPAELNVAAIDRVVPDLAARTLAAYERGGNEPLSMIWLQLAAGRYGDARRMLQAARESGASDDWAESVPLEIFAAAKSRQPVERTEASEALAASFREVFGTLDDKRAFAVARQMQLWSGEDMRQAAVSSIESKRRCSTM